MLQSMQNCAVQTLSIVNHSTTHPYKAGSLPLSYVCPSNPSPLPLCPPEQCSFLNNFGPLDPPVSHGLRLTPLLLPHWLGPLFLVLPDPRVLFLRRHLPMCFLRIGLKILPLRRRLRVSQIPVCFLPVFLQATLHFDCRPNRSCLAEWRGTVIGTNCFDTSH